MGKSRAGSRSTPSLVHETRPTTSSAPIVISMNSGRRIEMLVSHIEGESPGRRTRRLACQGCPRLDLWGDDVAVGQVIQAACRDDLTIVDAAEDLSEAIALETELYGLAMYSPGRVDGDHQRLAASG